MEIEIRLNGEKTRVPEQTSVATLIEKLNLNSARVAVEFNHGILKREKWQSTKLAEGDRIEIVHFVGGG